MSTELSEKCLQNKLKKSLQIIRKYDWIIDACVCAFYEDDHWSKLPRAWQKHFKAIQPEDLTFLFNGAEQQSACHVWPLELLALRQLRKDLVISRCPEIQTELTKSCPLVHHPKLRNLFTKRVKQKKRHELGRMAAFCKRSIEEKPVDFLLDFGSGVGHLARLLGYGYGIKVCGLERQEALSQQAVNLDLQLENMALKHLSPLELANFQRPTHLLLELTAEMKPLEFLSKIKNALKFPSMDFTFGLIGLHSCGDLGAVLMNMFLRCSQAKFINFVGCCYMKLSTRVDNRGADFVGYPLSNFLYSKLASNETHLSYAAREISCHSEEVYTQRLRNGDYEDLKIHALRACAEEIINQRFTMLRDQKINSVKYAPGMTFEDYLNKAIPCLPMQSDGCLCRPIDLRQSELERVELNLRNWHHLVIFYTLRLLFAPLIESIMLFDRLLFLQENDCIVDIRAIFDPFLSPRNHITSAFKKS